jgi:hypothetical protein
MQRLEREGGLGRLRLCPPDCGGSGLKFAAGSSPGCWKRAVESGSGPCGTSWGSLGGGAGERRSHPTILDSVDP